MYIYICICTQVFFLNTSGKKKNQLSKTTSGSIVKKKKKRIPKHPVREKQKIEGPKYQEFSVTASHI